ncbi:MAG: Ig-like domain-containing protein, partial [Synergistaceae bacterium]|nr:Ig-like domain-containing protein [Synergistaceae bacterium]
AVVTPLEASERVARWSSDNEKVATVDGAGQVTAVAVGRATITAQTWQGATGEGEDPKSDSVEVVVTRGGLTPIPVDPARDSGGGGGCNGGLLAPVLALVLFLFAATRKPSSFKNK